MSRYVDDGRGQRPAIESRIEGIEWPGIPGPWAAIMLAILEQMEISQWWDPVTLRAHQMRQLRSLFRHAIAQVPHYGNGSEPASSETAGELDMAQWTQLPVLGRTEVRDCYEALRSRQIPGSHGPVGAVSTSGSTGHPITVATTRLARMFAATAELRAHRWHGRELGGRLASIYFEDGQQAPYPTGLQLPGWGWPAGAIYRTGTASRLNLRTPIPDQAEWLQRQRPNYLLSCPSNLLALAEHCIEQGIRFSALRHVATIMEVVTPELREACRLAWEAPVVDAYSAREVGVIAVQCPKREHYHIMAENMFVEILDDDGLACAPGEVGRVVVTPLHNFAMPLLRYELGDYAEVGGLCPCSRGLPVLKRILGRVRNMLVLPDGQRCWPPFNFLKVAEIASIRQTQVVQTALHALEFRLVTERSLTLGEEERIRTNVAACLPTPFEIVLRYVDRIERGSGGKFEDFYSEVDR